MKILINVMTTVGPEGHHSGRAQNKGLELTNGAPDSRETHPVQHEESHDRNKCHPNAMYQDITHHAGC